MFGQSIYKFQSPALLGSALPIALIARRMLLQLVRVASRHLALIELEASAA